MTAALFKDAVLLPRAEEFNPALRGIADVRPPAATVFSGHLLPGDIEHGLGCPVDERPSHLHVGDRHGKGDRVQDRFIPGGGLGELPVFSLQITNKGHQVLSLQVFRISGGILPGLGAASFSHNISGWSLILPLYLIKIMPETIRDRPPGPEGGGRRG